MVKFAKENGVLLADKITAQARIDAGNAVQGKGKTRSYDEMLSSFTSIRPYVENNALRAPIGLWREHIALADIYQFELDKANKEFKNLWNGDDNYYQLQSDIQRLKRKIKSINTKTSLSEQQLKKQFSTESVFDNFKNNYDILYQKYMHRSHTPFNTVFGMGQQDADENSSIWNRSISDDRPHRDIFYNSYKDFEKINALRKKRVTRPNSHHRMKEQNTSPEYTILNSIRWDD